MFKLGKNALGFSASTRRGRGREKMETLTRLTFGASLPSRPLIAACPKREFVPSLKRRWVAMAEGSGGTIDATNVGDSGGGGGGYE